MLKKLLISCLICLTLPINAAYAENTEELYKQAGSAFLQDDYAQAEELINQAIAANISGGKAQLLQGKIYYHTKRLKEAMETWKLALKREGSPDYQDKKVASRILYWIGLVNFSHKQSPLIAMEYLKAAMIQYPENSAACYLLAKTYLVLGGYKEAGEQFQLFLKLNPGAPARAIISDWAESMLTPEQVPISRLYEAGISVAGRMRLVVIKSDSEQGLLALKSNKIEGTEKAILLHFFKDGERNTLDSMVIDAKGENITKQAGPLIKEFYAHLRRKSFYYPPPKEIEQTNKTMEAFWELVRKIKL